MRRLKKISQREILRFAKWPPIRLQHLRANLSQLNKIIMDKRLKNFNLLAKEFIVKQDGSELPVPNVDGHLPIIRIKDEDKNKYGPRIWEAFPLNSKKFFELIPESVKRMLGTKKFEKGIAAFVKVSCWHRELYSCSECMSNNNTNHAYTNLEDKIFEEIHGITDEEIEEFNESISVLNNEDSDEELGQIDLNLLYEDLQNFQREV